MTKWWVHKNLKLKQYCFILEFVWRNVEKHKTSVTTENLQAKICNWNILNIKQTLGFIIVCPLRKCYSKNVKFERKTSNKPFSSAVLRRIWISSKNVCSTGPNLVSVRWYHFNRQSSGVSPYNKQCNTTINITVVLNGCETWSLIYLFIYLMMIFQQLKQRSIKWKGNRWMMYWNGFERK